VNEEQGNDGADSGGGGGCGSGRRVVSGSSRPLTFDATALRCTTLRCAEHRGALHQATRVKPLTFMRPYPIVLVQRPERLEIGRATRNTCTGCSFRATAGAAPFFSFRASAQYAPGRALHAGIGWFTTAGIALSICARSSTCRPLNFAPPASCAQSETASVFVPAAYDISGARGRAWNTRSHRCSSRCLALRGGHVSVSRHKRKIARTDGE
jgi:hypothetical protein